MRWQINAYVIPLLLAALISVVLTIAAWRRRPVPGRTAFACLMLAGGHWSISYAMELLSTDVATILRWVQIEYLGITTVPFFWFLLAFRYTRQDVRIQWRHTALLAIIPIVTVALAWTNSSHGLIWRDIGIDSSLGFVAFDPVYGSWFWLHTSYSYALVLAGTILFVRAVWHAPHVYRGQAIYLVIGAMLPWAANALFLFDLSPFPGLDLTPFAFTLTGLALASALFRFHFLDIVPVARNIVIDNMSDGVLVLDLDDRIVDANRVVTQIDNVVIEAALGLPVSEALPTLAAWLELSTAESDTSIREVNLTAADGARYYELRITPLLGWNDNETGRLVIVHDVTEQRVTAAALAAQTELFESLVNVARVTIRHTNLNDTLDSTLEVATDLSRAGAGSLFLIDERGHISDSILARSNASKQVQRRIERQVMEQGLAGWVFRNQETALIDDTRLDERWLSLSDEPYDARSVLAVPILIGDEMLGLLTLMHHEAGHFTVEDRHLIEAAADQMALALRNAQMFDAQLRLIAELSAARDEAESASRAKSTFLANMSHELRTPLTAILGYSELLMEIADERGLDDFIPKLRKVRLSGEHLLGVISGILDLSKIEAGKMELLVTAVDANHLLETVWVTAQPIVTQNDNELRLDFAPNLGVIEVDEVKVRQALLNLLHNAAKFTQEGEITLRAHRETEADGREWICFAVTDNGVGMAPEQLEEVFQPFTQGDASMTRKHGGTGLGLSISRHFCRMMGGDVTVESQANIGSTFTIRLPVTTQSSSEPMQLEGESS